MSSHSEWSQLNNSVKDVQRELVKNQNTLKWILIAALAASVVSVINFLIILFK